jgi:hypothetical protein
MSRKEREAELHENDFLLCNGTETKQWYISTRMDSQRVMRCVRSYI